jgi:FkbM family methyltransferase
MRAFGVYRNDLWARAPRLEVRGKYHGHLMSLDASDQLDRTSYFLGRYYDLATQLYMREAVCAGDTFVDVGANIGMLTILAAHLVGPEGRVISFEPNADVYRRLSAHVQRNQLENVSLNPVGLSDAPATLTLKVWAKNKGWGTFGTLSSEEQGLLTAEYQSQVCPGDGMLNISTGTSLMIKIDVEGFECHVLRGLSRTLRTHKPTVMTELIPGTLRRAGSSPDELFEIMLTHGYQAYAMDVKRTYLRYRLLLSAISAGDEVSSTNLVWLHPESHHFEITRRLCR